MKDIEVSENPFGIEYDSDNNDMYVTHFSSGDVLVVDGSTNTVIDIIDVNKTTTRLDPIEYNPNNHNIYVLNYDSGDISVINTFDKTIVATINIGDGLLEGGISSDGPIAIEYNPSNHNMYVANGYSNTVSVIDTSSSTPPPPTEEPRTIADILKTIFENPLNIKNSIDSSNEIKEILTDSDRDNDQRACSLLEQLSGEEVKNIQNIIEC